MLRVSKAGSTCGRNLAATANLKQSPHVLHADFAADFTPAALKVLKSVTNPQHNEHAGKLKICSTLLFLHGKSPQHVVEISEIIYVTATVIHRGFYLHKSAGKIRSNAIPCRFYVDKTFPADFSEDFAFSY